MRPPRPPSVRVVVSWPHGIARPEPDVWNPAGSQITIRFRSRDHGFKSTAGVSTSVVVGIAAGALAGLERGDRREVVCVELETEDVEVLADARG